MECVYCSLNSVSQWNELFNRNTTFPRNTKKYYITQKSPRSLHQTRCARSTYWLQHALLVTLKGLACARRAS